MPEFRRPSLIWPLLLIGLGALLLAQALGLLPGGIWAALAQLWPVLLILLGLHLLVGRRSSAGAALLLIAGVLLVAGSLTWAALRATQLPPGPEQTLVQTMAGVARLSVRINFQAGALRLSALGTSDLLMEGMVRNGPGETAWQDYQAGGDEGRLALEQQSNPLLAPFLALRGDTAQWDVRLAQHVPLSLNVNAGAGAAALDLTGLQLTSLDLTSGAGPMVVTLPGQPVRTVVHAGPGAATLNLPSDIGVRLTVHSGLGPVSLPARLVRSGEFYTSSGFEAARPFLDLEISAGLGGVVVN